MAYGSSMVMDDKLFQELASSINEAGRIRRGEEDASRTFELPDVDVRQVRAKTGLSQPQFASLLGVSAYSGEVGTLFQSKSIPPWRRVADLDGRYSAGLFLMVNAALFLRMDSPFRLIL